MKIYMYKRNEIIHAVDSNDIVSVDTDEYRYVRSVEPI